MITEQLALGQGRQLHLGIMRSYLKQSLSVETAMDQVMIEVAGQQMSVLQHGTLQQILACPEATVWRSSPMVVEARATCRPASIHRQLRRRIQALDRQNSAQLQIGGHLSSGSTVRAPEQSARRAQRGPGAQHSTGSWLSTLSHCYPSERHRLPSTQKQAKDREHGAITAVVRHVTGQVCPHSSSAAASGQPTPAVSSSTGLLSGPVLRL